MLQAARSVTDLLFARIRPEALLERPVAERHRFIFYIGHLEAFDWNLLARQMDLPPVDPALDRLFAFGIDPPPGQAPQDRPQDWPSLPQVQIYVRQARAAVDRVLAQAPPPLADVAIEHRWMHAETIAYLMHELSYADKLPGPVPPFRPSRPLSNDMLDIPTGIATLGRTRNGGFGWDNEFEQTSCKVPGFRISRFKVTNLEYRRFVEAGGPPPHFWVQREREWHWRGMFGEYPLPLNAPVWVTQRQASAYAAWVGKRLPTEAEFHRAAFGTANGEERQYPWGSDPPALGLGHFDFNGWDPVRVDGTPAGRSAFGAEQMLGNGWEWTSTVFGPLPGFEPSPFYPGYSADFFDGQHYVLKGGSPRTAARLLRRSFRNWFRPEYPYVYAGFRVVDR